MSMTDVWFQIVLALLGIVAGIVAALLSRRMLQILAILATVLLISISSAWIGYEFGKKESVTSNGRLEGVLTDRTGNPLSEMRVRLQNGAETVTDQEGRFVLDNAPVGDQMIVVTPPSGAGQLTQNIVVESETTKINIVYDSASSRLGLLSITAPVDGGTLEVSRVGTDHRATIHGRCDGLAQIFSDQYEIWVLIRSSSDSRLWVQHPPAIVDLTNNTWRANIILGDPDHPPSNGDDWDITAVAAEPASGISQILNTPTLKKLPSHISSNVVTAELQIQ